MKNYIIGFIFFGLLIALAMFFTGDKNKADLSSLDEPETYEPCKTSGHPLWQDC